MERNLKTLSQQELLDGAKHLVAEEVKIGLQLIEYLREIESQLIYAELGFDSMWSFCVRYLGLSEGDAHRKLATMKLCKVIPEVKEDITQGKLSMTNAAKVQSFFNAEKRAGNDLPLEKKKEVLESVHTLSKSECEKKLMELSPSSAIPSERLRPITQEQTELKVVLDSETLRALDQLKDLLAHALGDVSYQALIRYMAADTLKRVKKAKGLEIEKGKKTKRQEAPSQPRPVVVKHEETSPPPVAVRQGEVLSPLEAVKQEETLRRPVTARQEEASPPPVEVLKRQAIPANIRRMVFHRAEGKCEYQSPDGRRCGSRHRVEINHKVPVAWGGSNDLSNLELTCRNHNVLHAHQTMGPEWMEKFRAHP